MKIIQLQYFVEVVKSNNISKAAKKLYVSQPSISTSIKELEKEFNTTLFIRYNNQLTLTDEGHFLYVQAVKLLQEFDKVHDDMMSYVKKAEILKIGIPPMIGTFFVPKILEEFSKDHPHVEFQLIELASKANREAMLNQEISLGLTVKEKKEAFPDSLKYHKVVNTTLLFVVNKNHPLAKKKVIDIPDLDNVPLILMKEDALQSSLVQKVFKKNNSKIEVYFAGFCLRKTRLFALRRLRGSFLHSVPELKALQSFADLHSFHFFCKTLIFYYFFSNHLTTSIFCGNIPQQYDAG